MVDLQPDQQPDRWNGHVSAYEAVFEPLTTSFARHAVAELDLGPAHRCLDVAAGTGGAAILAARTGAHIVASDAASAMVERIRSRAARHALPISIAAMDAQALAFGHASFDAAFSIFGIILCPDPGRALREIARVVRPGGRIVLTTWTDPRRYELVARLIAAIAAVRGAQPAPSTAPAQLRFQEEGAFRGLFDEAGVSVCAIRPIEATLNAPSARWLSQRLAFAPGMAAMLAAQGTAAAPILERFVADLERDQGTGPISLGAIAFLGVGQVAAPAAGQVAAPAAGQVAAPAVGRLAAPAA